MTTAQHRLKELHGTPDELEAAVWRAHADLWVTYDEALAAIGKYRDDWREASRAKEPAR